MPLPGIFFPLQLGVTTKLSLPGELVQDPQRPVPAAPVSLPAGRGALSANCQPTLFASEYLGSFVLSQEVKTSRQLGPEQFVCSDLKRQGEKIALVFFFFPFYLAKGCKVSS